MARFGGSEGQQRSAYKSAEARRSRNMNAIWGGMWHMIGKTFTPKQLKESADNYHRTSVGIGSVREYIKNYSEFGWSGHPAEFEKVGKGKYRLTITGVEQAVHLHYRRHRGSGVKQQQFNDTPWTEQEDWVKREARRLMKKSNPKFQASALDKHIVQETADGVIYFLPASHPLTKAWDRESRKSDGDPIFMLGERLTGKYDIGTITGDLNAYRVRGGLYIDYFWTNENPPKTKKAKVKRPVGFKPREGGFYLKVLRNVKLSGKKTLHKGKRYYGKLVKDKVWILANRYTGAPANTKNPAATWYVARPGSYDLLGRGYIKTRGRTNPEKKDRYRLEFLRYGNESMKGLAFAPTKAVANDMKTALLKLKHITSVKIKKL